MSDPDKTDTAENPILHHLKNRIGTTPITYVPFPHLLIHDIFPYNYYLKLLDYRWRLQMQPLDPKRPERKLLYLDESVRPTSEFWADFAETILDKELRMTIAYYFGVSGGSKCEAQLIRDWPGYQLGIHTDIPSKLVTGLYYLAPDDLNLQHGTRLYTSKSGCEDGGYNEYDIKLPDFDMAKLIEYRPNSALFFPRTNWSFHAVERTPVERWLVSYDILV